MHHQIREQYQFTNQIKQAMAIKRRAQFSGVEASALFDNLSKATIWELFMDLMYRNFGDEVLGDGFFSEKLLSSLEDVYFSFGNDLDKELITKIQKAKKDAAQYHKIMERKAQLNKQ